MGLLLAIFAIYAQCADHDFIFFDDGSYIYENPMVNRGFTADGVLRSITEAHSANWHPLTWWAHMLDVELFGLNPDGHILTNTAIHAFAAVALLFFIERLTGSLAVAAFVAFVFAVHPANVENVAWTSEKKSTLSALFGFLALNSYVRYGSHGNRRSYWLALGWYVLSLAAKPMLVTLPALLLLLDWFLLRRFAPFASASRVGPAAGSAKRKNVRATPSPDGTSASDAPATPSAQEDRPKCPPSPWPDQSPATEKRHWLLRWRPLLIEKLPFILLAAASCVITSVVQHQAGAMGDLARANWGARCANAVFSSWRYLDLLFLPRDHAILYPFLDRYPWPLVVLGVLGLIAVSLLLLRYSREVPWLAFGWYWYLVTLLPVIGIVQVGSQAMADRYLYLPMIGLLLGLGMTVRQVAHDTPAPAGRELERRQGRRLGRIFAVLATGWIAALTLAAWAQASYWTDSERLFRQAITNTKNNFLQHGALGLYFHKLGRYAEAELEFRSGLAIRPANAGLHTNLAVTLERLGRTDESIAHLEAAINLAPKNPTYRYNVAILYVRRGRLDDGIRECQVALCLDPAFKAAQLLLEHATELKNAASLATPSSSP